MKKYFIFLTLLAIGCASSSKDQERRPASFNQTGSSKFCHVNAHGYRQCNYRSLGKCNQARRYLEGICVKNEI